MDKRTELALKIYDFIENQFKEEIENRSEDLLFYDDDNEYNCHEDKDYIDGMCVRCDEVYDESKLYGDAVNKVIDDLDNGDGKFLYENVCCDLDFISLMKEMIKEI